VEIAEHQPPALIGISCTIGRVEGEKRNEVVAVVGIDSGHPTLGAGANRGQILTTLVQGNLAGRCRRADVE
jgi:hypothetical protein